MSAAVTAEQLVSTLKRRRTMLPAEMGTFIALETCEELIRRGPCAVTLGTVSISEEGRVALADAPRVDEETSARSLHRGLAMLLVAAGPAPSPGLMRLVESGPRGATWTLGQLRDDLEASLVPLNRNASRRVLARLVREVAKDVRPSVRPGAPPTFRDLDTQLSSFLGVEEPETSAPEPAIPAASSRERERDLTVREAVEHVDPSHDEVAFFDDVETKRTPLDTARTQLVSSPGEEHVPAAPVPSMRRAPATRIATSIRPSRYPGNSRGLLLGVLFVGLAVGLFATTVVLRPEALARLLGESPDANKPAQPSTPTAPPRREAGDLVVRVSPERAQVLRFVGRGPVTVEHLPVGVAHEFVAVLEGSAPTRVVIPSNAEWERTPDGPRFELAMQLGSLAGRASANDLGESLLPSAMGTPSGQLGSVRIVTTPRAAKVYQLVGFAPEARIENLPLDNTQEIMVFRKGYAVELRVIAPSDFASPGKRPVAEVRVELAPLGKAHE